MRFIFCIFILFSSSAVYAGIYPDGLSVVDSATAQKLFAEILTHTEIPFDVPEGCHAKAQKIAMLLEEQGIISGKAFVEGYIFRDSSYEQSLWVFHVAPFILVQKGAQAEPYVIDPLLSSKLVPYQQWLSYLKQDSRTKITSVYFTSRFVYDPKNRNATNYDPELIADMEATLATLRARKQKTNRFPAISVSF